MTCTVFRIEAGPQTGKSLIVTGALKQVNREGGSTLLITRNMNFGRHMCDRFAVVCDVCTPASRPTLVGYSAVAIDDADDLTWAEINQMRQELDKTPGPSMLLVVTTVIDRN